MAMCHNNKAFTVGCDEKPGTFISLMETARLANTDLHFA